MIDPSIALAVRPPQFNLDIPSPMKQLGQLLSLREMMQTNRIREQELAQHQMAMDAARQAQAGQEEFRRRMLAGETINPQQALGLLGPTGGTQYLEGQSKYEEQKIKQNMQRRAALASLFGSVKDTPTYNTAVLQAFGEGHFDADTARQALEHGYDPNLVRQRQLEGMTADQQDAARLKELEEQRKADEAARKSRLEGLGYAARIAPNTNQQDWNAFLAHLQQTYPGVVPLISPQYSPAAYQTVRGFGVTPTAPKPGVDVPYSPAVFAQQKELKAPQPQPPMGPERFQQELQLRQAAKNAELSAQHQQDLPLVQSIIANPSIYQDMSGETKARLAPQLTAAGFTGFGKPMSDTELGKIQDFDRAIATVADLSRDIGAKKDLVGPGSGLITMFPYAEERKKLQAQIDLGRQLVGKMLEGGVLRKEDEEKYKNILPTMTDLPGVALTKLERLQGMMKRDQNTYKSSLKAAGKRIDLTPQTTPTAPQTAPTNAAGMVTVTDPAGGTHVFRTQQEADNFKRLAGIK